MKLKRTIEVPFVFYGKHKWPKAPDSVGFLRALHPHEFHCSVLIEVFHNDRDCEFYLVREELSKIVFDLKLRLLERGSTLSCEMMAEFVCNKLIKKYGKSRDYKVSVSEDNIFKAHLEAKK